MDAWIDCFLRYYRHTVCIWIPSSSCSSMRFGGWSRTSCTSGKWVTNKYWVLSQSWNLVFSFQNDLLCASAKWVTIKFLNPVTFLWSCFFVSDWSFMHIGKDHSDTKKDHFQKYLLLVLEPAGFIFSVMYGTLDERIMVGRGSSNKLACYYWVAVTCRCDRAISQFLNMLENFDLLIMRLYRVIHLESWMLLSRHLWKEGVLIMWSV